MSGRPTIARHSVRNAVRAGLSLLLAMAAAASAGTPMATVTTLMNRPLPDEPGKALTMIMVDYPPGAVDPVHVHHAHALVYVLEGAIVMGVRGGKTVTLTRGQTFYEGPHDVHTVGRNASQARPARFLVVLLKKTDAPILTPVP